MVVEEEGARATNEPDHSAEVIASHVASVLETYHGQMITDGLTEAVRHSVAARIGGLMGVRDIAELLGVTPQRTGQLLAPPQEGSRRANPPSPIARLRATPVWLRTDIEDYMRRRQQ